MRELIARLVAIGTVLVVVLLASRFATVQQTPRQADALAQIPVGETPGMRADTASPAGPLPVVDGALVARGRQVYDELRCAGCHAIAGEGNPRFPLDGVAQRRGPAELKDWVLGTGPAAAELSASARNRKASYRTLSEPDLAALIAYLANVH